VAWQRTRKGLVMLYVLCRCMDTVLRFTSNENHEADKSVFEYSLFGDGIDISSLVFLPYANTLENSHAFFFLTTVLFHQTDTPYMYFSFTLLPVCRDPPFFSLSSFPRFTSSSSSFCFFLFSQHPISQRIVQEKNRLGNKLYIAFSVKHVLSSNRVGALLLQSHDYPGDMFLRRTEQSGHSSFALRF
jgi:hypothetical protein